MKSPEEIKKGLDICINDTYGCDERCPYFGCESNGVECATDMHTDALAYITQLESRLAQAERERDAAVREWKRTKMDSESMCWTCKHALVIGSCRCICVSPDPCDEGENWEWRGVVEENSHE